MSIENIGKNILQLRKEKGIKQEELANFVGISTQAVSKWENGGVPDTQLLPKIADFFKVSIDSLFGHTINDYGNLKSVLMKTVNDTPNDEKIKCVLNFCFDMEKAMMPNLEYVENGSIEDYEKGLEACEQQYSSMTFDNGFTRMGIANRSQYFLLVSDAKNCDTAYFDGIDYTSFFKDFSDKAFFNTCVFLNKRDFLKAFTLNYLIKNIGITTEEAEEIVKKLQKYNMISGTQIEMDDEVVTVYKFRPTPSFIALLIFARELISSPDRFAYYNESRNTPYLS